MCAALSPLQTCPAKKDSLFHRGHPGLQCAALAGPAGSAFLFLPALCPFCLNFHQREARCFSAGKDGYFVSEGFSRQLPLATAAHNWLTRPQRGRSRALLVSFRPAFKTVHRLSQGRVWISLFFLAVPLLWQCCQVTLQLVICRLLDRADCKPQGAISHLTRLSPHLSGFYVNEPFVL